MATTCTFTSTARSWNVTRANQVLLVMVKETSDTSPMVKIFIGGKEVQCVPRDQGRIWHFTKVSGTLTFHDGPDTGTLEECGAPVFCFRYTGHEVVFGIRMEEHGGSGKESMFICRDDIRNGSPMAEADHKFNIHNVTNTNAKSVRVIIRQNGANYDFVVMHMSGQPDTFLPTCTTSAPDPACIAVV